MTQFPPALLLFVVTVVQAFAQTPTLPATRGYDGGAAALAGNQILLTGGDGPAGPSDGARYLPGTDGSARSVAPMNVPRSNHVSITLSNGLVLVAGGRTLGGGATNAVEVFDPASGKWIMAGAMMTAREGATAALLADGSVLIAGGENDGVALATMERFDPALMSFVPVLATLSTPRVHAAATVLDDGTVLIAGGSDGGSTLSSVERYDPATGGVSPVQPMSTARAGLTATTLVDGRVLLAGGSDGARDLRSTEVFDPLAGTIVPGASMTHARRGHFALRIPGNHSVLVAGGLSGVRQELSVEIYRSWSDRWVPAAAPLRLESIPTLAASTSGNGGEAIVEGAGWTPGQSVSLILSEQSTLRDATGSATMTSEAGRDGRFQARLGSWLGTGQRVYVTAAGAADEEAQIGLDRQLPRPSPASSSPQAGERVQEKPTAARPVPLAGSLTATTTGLATSLSPAAAGQSVTLTATVTPAGAAGTVTFLDLDVGTPLGSSTLSGGTAQLSTTALGAGLHSLVAVYGGDSTHAASGSAILFQEVTPAPANTFAAATGSPIAAGYSPVSVAVGDFNGDGKLDLATANIGDNTVTVLLGDGTGKFTSASASPFHVGGGPVSIVAGDFNGDGKLDLATANISDNTVTVLLGNGAGNFTAANGSPFGVGGGPVSVTVGDFNGDGRLDLATANSSDATVTVLLGDGAGNFAPATSSPFAVGAGPFSVAVGDFNGDGRLDMAIPNGNDNNVTVLLGDGTGNFAQAGMSPFAVGNGPVSLAVGDFNGDGKLDLATANFGDGTATVLLGDGTGKFAPAAGSPFAAGSGAQSVVVGDFNGDGKLDLAIADGQLPSGADSRTVTLLLGNGTGGFSPAGSSPFPVVEPSSLAVGDFNGDGRLDLAMSSVGANAAAVLLGTLASATTLATSVNPATAGQPVTLTATVTPSEASGTVTFRDLELGTPLGTATLSAGKATLSTAALSVGLHSVAAAYGGDATHEASGSAPLFQEVIPAAANAFVGVGGNPVAVGSNPFSIAAGDINGDGKLDLVTANGGDKTVTVLLGDGTGAFAPASGSPFAVGAAPAFVALGDFNSDGKLDLATANNNNSVTVLLGDGTGKFTPASGAPFTAGSLPAFLAAGDFNGDGRLDLVIVNSGGNNVTVLLGDGTGNLYEAGGSPYAVGHNPVSVAVGDFNGDGKLDLATSNGDNTVTVLLGDGTGGFAQGSGSPFAVGSNPQVVAVGDFNGDGKLDLATANFNNSTVTVLLGDGTGKFTQSTGSPFTVGTGPAFVVAGDFNGDGKVDLATTNYNTNSVTVLLGDGTGRFVRSGGSPFTVGTGPASAAVGDFNGDGRLDLAVANGLGNSVTVLLGSLTTSTSVLSSINPSVSGQTVSFTATVTPSIAAGAVQFVVDGANFGSPVTVSGGVATSAGTSTLAVGNHTVTAKFTGAGTTGSSNGSLSGGQTVNSGTTLAQLSISSSHTGGFTQGQNGATYTVTVSNASGAPATNGTVTMTETAPSGLTLVSMTGTGWTCPSAGTTCTRSDSLAGGVSYPAIVVTVNVATNAPALVVNTVSVGWGGTETATATDNTVINQLAALVFVPLAPCRVADTRKSTFPSGFGTPSINGGTTRNFTIPNSSCGIPNTALAYSLNVAVVPSGPLGFITVWPAGQPQPVVATLNSTDGRTKSNAAIVPAGTSGAISVFATNTTDVVLDINGYFVPAGTPGALAFYPMTPCRIADTRKFTGPLGMPALVGGASRTFPILSSTCNVPSTAQAYSLNFAAVPPGPLGFITAFPTGQARPTAATLNAPTGTVVANAAIVPAGTGGSIDIFASNNTNLVIDIDGYFAPPGTGGLSLYTVLPCRVLDSRKPAGTAAFSGEKDVTVTGTCGAVPSAQAYVFNATVVPPGALGFLTLWPQGQAQPTAATLNALDGAVTNNMAIVKTTNGSIAALGSNPTQLVLDLFGFFAQ